MKAKRLQADENQFSKPKFLLHCLISGIKEIYRENAVPKLEI